MTNSNSINESISRRTLHTLRVLAIIILSVLVIDIGIVLYGEWESSKLEFNKIDMPVGTLPGLEGMRILVIGDIHSNDKQLAKAVEAGLAAKPDIAFILGDVIMATARTTRTRLIIKPLLQLSSQVPTFACLGNHDMEKLEVVERILQASRIPILRNSSMDFHCSRLGKNVTLAGIGDWWEYDCAPENCLTPTPKTQTTTEPKQQQQPQSTILLSHNPAARAESMPYEWNLMLSGHTHGGQLRYPFTKTAVFHRDNEPLTEGFHQLDETKNIFITRGIGSIFNLRLNCPPEFNLLIVH
ncbi:MAG: metallophosphoesterase [Akkermansia sp.]